MDGRKTKSVEWVFPGHVTIPHPQSHSAGAADARSVASVPREDPEAVGGGGMTRDDVDATTVDGLKTATSAGLEDEVEMATTAAEVVIKLEPRCFSKPSSAGVRMSTVLVAFSSRTCIWLCGVALKVP